jgi:methyl-accepting chemotaxis protein
MARPVSILITTIALAAVVAHLIWPDLAIDAIALALVGIAILPWLGPILESIELPGGFKASFREVKETIQEVKETTEAALSRTEEVHQTAQAALSETQAVKETAQAALSETQAVKETAQAALSETQAVKETAQAALSRTEEVAKKVSP